MRFYSLSLMKSRHRSYLIRLILYPSLPIKTDRLYVLHFGRKIKTVLIPKKDLLHRMDTLETSLSSVTKRSSEDKTLYLHVNQPLVIAAVGNSWVSPVIVSLSLNLQLSFNLKSMSCPLSTKPKSIFIFVAVIKVFQSTVFDFVFKSPNCQRTSIESLYYGRQSSLMSASLFLYLIRSISFTLYDNPFNEFPVIQISQRIF